MLRTGPNQSAIKLKNVAQPQYYLAVIGGYLVGYVRIGICSRFQNCVVKRITKALSTNPRRNRHTHHHCKTLHMFWPLIYWLGYTVADRGFPLRFRLATPVGSVLGITGLDIHPLL